MHSAKVSAVLASRIVPFQNGTQKKFAVAWVNSKKKSRTQKRTQRGAEYGKSGGCFWPKAAGQNPDFLAV